MKEVRRVDCSHRGPECRTEYLVLVRQSRLKITPHLMIHTKTMDQRNHRLIFWAPQKISCSVSGLWHQWVSEMADGSAVVVAPTVLSYQVTQVQRWNEGE